jgi:hypothetical protein
VAIVSLVHMAVELLAATPTPSPTGGGKPVAPADSVSITIGQTAEWFGPALVLAMAWLLDASAYGSHSARDRIASTAVYAGMVALISIYGWSDDIQGWFGGSYSWKLAGSAIAFVAHAAFLIAVFGENNENLKRPSKWIGGKFGFDGELSGKNRINTRLWWWATGCAATSVLARGAAGSAVHLVAYAITGIWAGIAVAATHFLGG